MDSLISKANACLIFHFWDRLTLHCFLALSYPQSQSLSPEGELDLPICIKQFLETQLATGNSARLNLMAVHNRLDILGW